MTKELITNLPLTQVQTILKQMKQPSFRYAQILQWVYQKRVNSINDMRNLPKSLRDTLNQQLSLSKLSVHYSRKSKIDNTVKFGFQANDSNMLIESVLLFDKNRRSLCISSQLGCNLGCKFCLTGTMGLIRNLSQHEIIGQLIGVNDYLASQGDKPVTNIIFMGMGEALLNYNNFLSSLQIIMEQKCFALGGRKITVSSAGIVPIIERFMLEKIPVNLALSLNAYNDAQRNEIMPINKKYPIKDLLATARKYYQTTGSMVTFEYVVIPGENDTSAAVSSLVTMLKNLPCKINLIPFNPGIQDYQSPHQTGLNNFAKGLADQGLTVTVRKSKGRDINGACGQLAGRFQEL